MKPGRSIGSNAGFYRDRDSRLNLALLEFVLLLKR